MVLFKRPHTTAVSDLSKFYTSPILGAIFGSDTLKFCHSLLLEKTRVRGLSKSVVCLILYLAVLVELRLVSQTDYTGYSVYRASLASRGNECIFFLS